MSEERDALDLRDARARIAELEGEVKRLTQQLATERTLRLAAAGNVEQLQQQAPLIQVTWSDNTQAEEAKPE